MKGVPKKISSLTRLMAASVLVLPLASPSFAQSAEGEDDAPALGEIVVTATKRPERLQDVPISVQAVTGDLLRSGAVQNFEDVQVPGLRVSRGGMADTITVRGIGSGQNLGFEQSAPMYIDGIYYGRARTQRLGFLDIDRIEFLKGPQPTFLGKNAIAGAINVATRRPGDEFGGEIEFSYEPVTNEKTAFGATDIPIGDNWATRFALRYRKSEGYITNTITGRKEPEIEDLLGRVVVTGDLSDQLKLTAIGYFGNNNDHGRNNQPIICLPNFRRDLSDATREPCTFDSAKSSRGLIPAAAETARPDLYTDDDGGSFYNRLRSTGGTLLLDYEFGNGITLSSVSGFYQYKNYQFIDTDQAIANYSTATFTEQYDQFSQEIRLISSKDSAFTWFLGAYVDKNNNDVVSTTDQDARNLLPLVVPAPAGSTPRTAAFVNARILGSITDFRENADSWAFFGEASQKLGPVTLRGGLRYEEINKDVDFLRCDSTPYSGCSPLPLRTGSRKDKKFQPAITLEARPAEDVMIYTSFKKGFKSGGFSGTDGLPFNPESANAYEIGLKSRFFDKRVLLNLTAFRSNYKDLQVSSFDPATALFLTTNAASARTQGLEAELQLAVTQDFKLSGNVTYLDATYEDFTKSQCWAGQTAALGCVTVGSSSTQDLSGVTTPYAPEWSGSIAADWSKDIGSGLTLKAGSDLYFTSRFATLTDIHPDSFQEKFAKLNARIGLSTESGWDLSLAVRNLTDKRTAAFKNTIPGGFNSIAAFTEPPRTFTIQARYKF
ncbi:TonB-dependent receptor [Sphingorhabdus sp.]|jgi:iron complex outermembrane receptor protein|uniref:TonB-dependent receptor n=1 Tax=Sphingorhabdus sp. TaxID=1902408 RepID=UPI0037C6E7A4